MREDRAPIERRITLPDKAQDLRWIAVSRNVDSGWLESPEHPYDVYVFLSLIDAGQTPIRGSPVTLALDAPLAKRLIPEAVFKTVRRTEDRVELAGVALEPAPTPKEPGVSVLAAVRLGEHAVIHFGVSGGT